ncbi:UDP-N-acetylglucosamine 1-carboxyvinyltransferase [Shewanella chilikensis]|uniref:UDP-N-acetylglucosamine 1-carboxyvinyltransferase n=1 Tax=Shewanella chilikensis TaxID=558541 RepID=UPI001CD74B96|nr:UDP-N-acetylglucosamine 1-carboxyvinyltransferase [Shewanella chilikensis]MCA0950238.1 UDP-N-acetylglucosamine 1-carboxyvinyltransferase [Shewanella chilikensis]
MNKKIKVLPSELNGTVKVSGAKNSVLRLLAASILFDNDVILRNYPKELLDVQVHEGMLKYLGKSFEYSEQESVKISQTSSLKTTLDWNGRSIRNTLLILGGLVTKYGYGKVPLPGGCKLGERKYDIHVDVLESLGATVYEEGDYLVAKSDGRLQGTDIKLRMRSTGATENAIIMATLAQGTTNIYNPHIRPEIIDLTRFLNNAGAKIVVHGQERIEISGVEKLLPVNHSVMPDNMEALTWAVIGAVTKSTITIEDFPFKDLEVPLIHLRESGVNLYRSGNNAIIGKGNCYPVEISTGPYPGINSDMQPIFAAFAAFCNGDSHIIDLRFPGRYGYAEEMKKMGVDSSVNGDLLVIHGRFENKIVGDEVKALDLRAGIMLLILGLAASEGATVISDSWQIKRGYNNILEKLSKLGANVVEI